MRRQQLVVDTSGALDALVVDATHDSRTVTSGSLFCAVPGLTVDGHQFAASAVASGASALLVERFLDLDVAQVRVPECRKAMPVAAAEVHHRPSESIDVFGITGTNGKTTTTHLLASVARAAGRQVELVGTLSGQHTTPESTDWQRLLRASVEGDDDLVVAEVSSHALDQGRVDATDFAVVAFSNLSPDHLDYHGDLDAYFEAKCRLFDGRARHELINVDDEWGRRLAERRPRATPVRSVGLRVLAADLGRSVVEWRGDALEVPLPGAMNVANAVLAAEAGLVLGFDDASVRQGIADTPPIAGRMQIVGHDLGPIVIVDYSHTPDSIERTLASVRELAPTRKIAIVFGCGGDRDRAKRPLMARAAEAHADLVVVTSDNPRTEDPEAIIADVVDGLIDPTAVIVDPDRRSAIGKAIDAVGGDDVVLVAGKGHETTQTVGDQVLAFDDVQVVGELLDRRRGDNS